VKNRPIFYEMCYTTADSEPDDGYVTKIYFFKFKMADGRHHENRFWTRMV